jgi:hypothetical protein
VSVLVAVTDHAAERFRQRVGSGGALDVKPEIVRRVAEAWDADRWTELAPAGTTAARGSVYVKDKADRSLIYVCRRDGAELIVITLWEQEGGVAPPRVGRQFTNALKQDDERKREQ